MGLIVLLFQAILLAHGGLTTLGANTFSMAIAGPFLSYGIYKLCQKLNVNRKVAVFLAAFFGDLFTYCVTSLQLAMAYPSEAGAVGGCTRAVASSRMLLSMPVVMRMALWLATALMRS